tara:strand:+ start:727 stop:834 length:108 start_codon:yes stop_codon:yes gene_type:complete
MFDKQEKKEGNKQKVRALDICLILMLLYSIFYFKM